MSEAHIKTITFLTKKFFIKNIWKPKKIYKIKNFQIHQKKKFKRSQYFMKKSFRSEVGVARDGATLHQ